MQSQFMVQMGILPIEQFFQLMTSLKSKHYQKRTNVMPKYEILTLLDKQMTGHIEHPKVQQQQRQPQKSQRTLTGRFFRRVTLTLVTVALNSSGATRACNPEGNSVSNRLDNPNLKDKVKSRALQTRFLTRAKRALASIQFKFAF